MITRRRFSSEDTATVTLLEEPEEPGEKRGKPFCIITARRKSTDKPWTTDVERYTKWELALSVFGATIQEFLTR